mgnify:FL=1
MAGYNFAQFDGLRPEDIAAFARFRFRDEIENPTRLGERILPFVQQDDWRVSTGRLKFRPVASAIIAPDSPLPTGPLGTFDERDYGLLKGGQKYRLIESEIRKLIEIFHNGRRATGEEIIRSRPYELANALVTGYLDRAEAMRWEVLTTGEYVIPNSGGTVKIDYGFEPTQKIALTLTDKWDQAATADGLADLLEWDDLIYQNIGVHSQFTVISRTALTNLLAQEATKTRLANAGYAGIGGMVAPNANQLGIPFFIDSVNAYLNRYGVGPLVLYDRMYNSADPYGGAGQPTLTRFMAENAFVMVAPTAIDGGFGFDGGTATGLQADGPVVENGMTPGLYVWLAEQDEPYEVQVKSVFWTVPVIHDPRTIVSGTLW